MFVVLKSLCTCWIVSVKARAKTVFGYLKRRSKLQLYMSLEEIYFYFIWKPVVMHWKQWCAGKSTIIATILVNQEKKVTKLSIYHIRLSLLGRMLRNSWLGFDCLPIKIGGSHGAPGHRLPWGEAFSYWVVLFYCYVFNLLCFAP